MIILINLDHNLIIKKYKENLIPGGGDYIQIVDRKVHICGYLKNFLFDPKEIDQNVGFLSGGERSRLC